MNLDEAQKKTVTEWIAEGAKLSEIQNRLASEFGLRLTYMDVRFLVDDLKLTPKDTERPPEPKQSAQALPTEAAPADVAPKSDAAVPGTGGVSVTVDQIARAGAIASGKVTFSDGNTASWQLDQQGRLGLVAAQTGYRPPAADLQQFQAALEKELMKMGF